MAEFRGYLKEIGRPLGDNCFSVGGYRLMPAPNRYRKMLEPDPKIYQSYDGAAWNNEAVIARQAADFPWPHPAGIECDLFDTYLSWRIDG
jgi:hypothetical protein